jgi:hypothetical protein
MLSSASPVTNSQLYDAAILPAVAAAGYRLFLQFKDEGRVQTVAFTREVGL